MCTSRSHTKIRRTAQPRNLKKGRFLSAYELGKQFSKKSPEQREFVLDCAEWVVIAVITLNTPEQVGFRRLLSKRDERYDHVSCEPITRELKKIHHEAIESYKNELSSISRLGIPQSIVVLLEYGL